MFARINTIFTSLQHLMDQQVGPVPFLFHSSSNSTAVPSQPTHSHNPSMDENSLKPLIKAATSKKAEPSKSEEVDLFELELDQSQIDRIEKNKNSIHLDETHLLSLDEEDPEIEKEEEHIFPVFGRPLGEVAGAFQVPYIVRSCVKSLCQIGNTFNFSLNSKFRPFYLIKKKKESLHEQGILRQSGSKVLIDTLKKKFDEGKRPNLTKVDPHAVSGLLKLYFRELPEPVIPAQLNQQFSEIIGKNKT